MTTKAKQLGKVAILALSLWYGNVTAQTKTEKETIPVSTGHASISVQAKKNGSSLEVWVYNNSTTPYKVSFTANITLRGDKGEFTKTISYSGEIAPNKSDYTMPVYISYANATTTDVYNSLTDGEVNNFKATPIEKENTSVSSSGNASYSGSNNNTSTTTTANETRYNTNPQVKEAVERQNRLQNLQQQQEQQQKAQQQANYEKAIAYEQKRQESIQQTNEVVGAVTDAITDYLNQQAEEKKRKQEAEERRLEREYEQRMAEYERKTAIEAKINNRKTAIAEFPVKDIPLGSQEKAVSIYYFVYAYDNTINNEYGATVYVSNVFEIGKYNDGTRAYTSTIKNEITNLTPFAEVLHGYYYTQQEAEQLRQTLISILKNNGVAINEVNYKGKPATVKNAETENTTPKANQSKYGKTINLAPATLNDPTPSEVPKQNLEKAKEKESKYGKTIKID
ncbi:hypothetical protein [Sphingobacterium lumbrici]|uniref:hypothetical protein n=1 Tax=Sphingobacterium lumbrici TaxID=2559600 RepID=UPI00112DB391|nr:hypothetical protein [Sphingobacterium lumbrici]